MKTTDAVRTYVGQQAALAWRPSTVRSSRWTLQNFADAAPELVGSIRQRHVVRWLQTQDSIADGTKRTRLSTLKGWFAWCVTNGHLDADPAHGLTIRVERRRIPRAVRAELVPAVLNACPDARARAIVLTSVHLGLRRAEIAELQVDHLDWENQRLMVRGKGGYHDMMPVPDEAWRAILAYLAEHPASTGPLFRSYTSGRALSPPWVYRIVAKALYEAGAKMAAGDGVSMHSLRHRMILDVLRRTRDPQQTRLASRHRSWAGFNAYTNVVLGDEELRQILEGRQYR